jgi:hypothetical protein
VRNTWETPLYLFGVKIGLPPHEMAHHQLSTSLIHDFIANFAAYCIPASLDLIMDDLQAITNVPDPQQGEVTSSSKSEKPWSEAEVNDLVKLPV